MWSVGCGVLGVIKTDRGRIEMEGGGGNRGLGEALGEENVPADPTSQISCRRSHVADPPEKKVGPICLILNHCVLSSALAVSATFVI